MERIEVGVLGATGMVGQQFVTRLARHPWFNLTWLAASERSEGKTYKSVAPWRLSTPIPDGVGRPHGRGVHARARAEGRVLGPRRVGGRRHRGRLRRRRPHRRQQRAQLPHGPGRAAADSGDQRRSPRAAAPSSARRRAGPAPSSPTRTARRSCSRWRLRRSAPSTSAPCVVSTMQAVSGAGYPGVPSLDILGNVVPFIGGEEEKMETETLKILGTDGRPRAAPGRGERAHQPRAGPRRAHDDRIGGSRCEALAGRCRAGDARVRRPAAGAGSADGAAAGHRRDGRAEPAAAAAGRRPAAAAWP